MIRDTRQQDKVIQQTRRLPRLWLAMATAIGLVGAATASYNSFDQLLSADQVVSLQNLRTATVIRGDMVQDLRVEGRTMAADSPSMYAIAAGTVTLFVKAGDEIKAGQALLTIDSPELRNQLLQEEATLARLEMEVSRQKIAIKQQQLDNTQQMELAKVELEAAQSEMARARTSIEKQIISKEELEQTEVALKRAELNERHAIASLQLAQERLSFELKSSELNLTRQRHLTQELRRDRKSVV